MYQLQRVRIIPDIETPIEPVLAAPGFDPTGCDIDLCGAAGRLPLPPGLFEQYGRAGDARDFR